MSSGLPHDPVGIAIAIPIYAGVVIAAGVIGKVAGIAVGTLLRGAH